MYWLNAKSAADLRFAVERCIGGARDCDWRVGATGRIDPRDNHP